MISFWAHRALAIAAMLGIIGLLGATSARADFVSPGNSSVLLAAISMDITLVPVGPNPNPGFPPLPAEFRTPMMVFPLASPSGAPFTVDNGQVTFIPGGYSNPNFGPDWLLISPDQTGGKEDFSLWGSGTLFEFALPLTVVPSLEQVQGNNGTVVDEYVISGVQARMYSANLPEPSALEVLGLMAVLLCFARLWTVRKEDRES